MQMNRSRYLWLAAILIALAVIAEVTLRLKWGFGQMVLFDEDPGYEYIARPNQNRMRFGNTIVYNEYSMRSDPLLASDSCVILGFGDSVVNGGTLSDQDSLATTMVEREFGKHVRFLNVSAGSWGPDNCAAFLKKHGHFNAKLIVLFVSSHDAHDNMEFEKTVGVHESYPDAQYPLAIIEVIDKYIIPILREKLSHNSTTDNLMINKGGETFNSGFAYFYGYTQQHHIPLIIFHHAELAEVQKGEFNEQGKEIVAFCEAHNIPYISGLQIGETASDFRDEIHINDQGQKRWARFLLKDVKDYVKQCL
ncbi:MAG TPA: hypothetical protein VK666_19720 [Chryseolinea sp.]|nr:hypothetical protein [Chryseolinea sp.]